ncbi:MAG TPA: hypothetical protein VGH03_20730 [Caulobacteraceae bacterium]|jgi:hypothetical protein
MTGEATLWAVIVGAILATVGGFVATQLEAHFRRRERERSAALLFGEILSVIEIIAALTNETREIGDPYGLVTMRMLRAIRRETEVYERNRESLYDLRDGEVRARIHTVMVRMTLALEGVFDATSQIALAENAARGLSQEDALTDQAMRQVSGLIAARQTAFDFLMQSVGQIADIVSVLRRLARQPIGDHADVARNF